MSIPYGAPVYFLYLAVALIPIVVGLMFGKRLLWYQNLVTLYFLYLTFGGENYKQGIALIIYVLWQVLLIWLYHRYRGKKNETGVYFMALFGALLPLVLYKLLPAFHVNPSFIGFLGISYLTFKAVQMVMEIRDGQIKTFSMKVYIQFLLFFPTISSGPIDRYRRFEKDFEKVPEKEDYLQLVDKAIFMIFLGFLYKFIIGYYLKTFGVNYFETALLDNTSFWNIIMYMYSYSLYLFFDFAGYSLFAVGISHLMGIRTPVNFNKPFISPNIKEFWNRWHMSLSFWFRDFVFMRMVFFLMKKKVFKSRTTMSNVGYMSLFLLMGVWHGLTWYYIVYGLFHGLAICVNDAWIRYKKKHKNLPSNIFTKCLAIFITFNTVCISFLIFSGVLDKLWHH